jgi:hypothetical protein
MKSSPLLRSFEPADAWLGVQFLTSTSFPRGVYYLQIRLKLRPLNCNDFGPTLLIYWAMPRVMQRRRHAGQSPLNIPIYQLKS